MTYNDYLNRFAEIIIQIEASSYYQVEIGKKMKATLN